MEITDSQFETTGITNSQFFAGYPANFNPSPQGTTNIRMFSQIFLRMASDSQDRLRIVTDSAFQTLVVHVFKYISNNP